MNRQKKRPTANSAGPSQRWGVTWLVTPLSVAALLAASPVWAQPLTARQTDAVNSLISSYMAAHPFPTPAAAVATPTPIALATPVPGPTPAAPPTVIDSHAKVLGQYSFDPSSNIEYVMIDFEGLDVEAQVGAYSIKGGAEALYFEGTCGGDPYIEADPGSHFQEGTTLAVPYTETFSLIAPNSEEGASPLYYADSSSDYGQVTVCAMETTLGDCEPISPCEPINAFPAKAFDWESQFVTPFAVSY